jgi:Ni/Co efflux regulator RcnB
LTVFFHEQEVMSEKQETDDFDEPEEEELEGDEEVDLARLTKDMDTARRRSVRNGMPAMRKLELLAEQRRTAELTSDFEDYELDEPRRTRRGAFYA